MANKGEDDMYFWKSVKMSVFQRLKFGSKIVEILQKCRCNMDYLQEIALDYLVWANKVNYYMYYIRLGTIWWIYNGFKQIFRDGVLLTE